MRLIVALSIATSIAAATAVAQPREGGLPRFVGGRQVTETPQPQPTMPAMPPQEAQRPANAPAPDAPALLNQPQAEPRRQETAERTPAPRQTPRPTPRATPRATSRESEQRRSEREDVTVSAVDAATSAVGDFLRKSNDGMYSEAEKMLTPHLRGYFKHEISAATGGLKAVADQITKDGRIRLVRYSNWRGRGEGGRLDVEITYDLGTEQAPRMVTEKRTFEVQKVDGKWYVIVPVVPGAAVDGMVTESAVAQHDNGAPAPPEATPAATPAPPPPDPTPAAPQASTPPQGGDQANAAPAAAAADRRTTSSALEGLPW